jgi:hypothetical protein
MAIQYQRDTGFANETSTVQYQSNGVFVNVPGPAAISGTASLTTNAASLSGTGSETFSGTASWTGNAASLSGQASEVFSGTGAITCAAASLSAQASEIFSGSASWASANISLDISGILSYNGTATVETASASLSGTGSVAAAGSITGTAHIAFGPAALHGKGRRRLKAGHDLVDLAQYNQFVSQGDQILEELGQPVPQTDVQEPELTPVPLPEPTVVFRNPLVETLIKAPEFSNTPRIAPTKLKGKKWIKGQVQTQSNQIELAGRATLELNGQAHAWNPEPSLHSIGGVDNYYSIRQHDEKLIEEFILNQLLGRVA